MATFPTPAAGDVIFTRDIKKAAVTQSKLQPLIDKEARGSRHVFSHVALLFAPERAVEAVPHRREFAEKLVFGELVDGERVTTVECIVSEGDGFKLEKQTYPVNNNHEFREYSKRTKVPLTRGIRGIPTADIIIDAYETGTEMVVLRKPGAAARAAEITSQLETALLPILESAYDLARVADRMQADSAEALLEPPEADSRESWLVRGLRVGLGKIVVRNREVVDSVLSRLKTKPNDPLPRLSPEQRKDLAEHATSWLVASEVASFYCSNLVAELLVAAGLATPDEVGAQFTPTGLYQRLLKSGWEEVTATDYSAESVTALHASSRALLDYANSFLVWYRNHRLNVQFEALDVTTTVIKLHQDRFTARLEALTRDWAPSTKPQ